MADQTRPDEPEAKRRIRRGVVALVAGLMFSAAVTFLALPHLVSVLFINPTVEGTVVSQPVTRCSGSSGNRSCTTFAEVRFRTLEGEIIEKRTNVKNANLFADEQQGDSISVRYFENDPNDFAVESTIFLFGQGLVALVIGPLLLIILVTVGIRRVRRT